MGRPLFPHSLDRLAILAGRVVCPTPETFLDTPRVSLRASVVNSLFVHGRCGLVGLETGRTFWGAPCSDTVRCATRA